MNVFSMRRSLSVCVATLFAVVSASVVHAVAFTATLSGSNEVPPNASTNVGTTRVDVDPASSTISWVTTSSVPLASVTGHQDRKSVV